MEPKKFLELCHLMNPCLPDQLLIQSPPTGTDQGTDFGFGEAVGSVAGPKLDLIFLEVAFSVRKDALNRECDKAGDTCES